MPFLGIGVVVVMVLAVVLIVIGFSARDPKESLQARLAEYSSREQAVTLEEIEMSMPFSERIIAPMVRSVAEFVQRFTPERTLEATRHKLDLAGNPQNWSPAEFFGLRALAMVVLGGLIFLVLTVANAEIGMRLLMTVVFAALGFFLPALWLGSKIRSRQNNIVKSLPDALDLLTVCVDAGLAFDQAIKKVTEKWNNELSHAFARLLQEIQLGRLRREAMRDMANRMEVTDVTSFVAAIIQAETLGVSISKILRIQSDQMRMRRRQRAEEKAHQASIKMLIPMVFLIFPSIWVVLLGPAILQAISTDTPLF
ncbi:MAG TPA: type II secretion system F family protein [Anaerolineae bacterium]|nr:type II secretion system F family protein [Anaerolineae bacterium]